MLIKPWISHQDTNPPKSILIKIAIGSTDQVSTKRAVSGSWAALTEMKLQWHIYIELYIMDLEVQGHYLCLVFTNVVQTSGFSDLSGCHPGCWWLQLQPPCARKEANGSRRCTALTLVLCFTGENWLTWLQLLARSTTKLSVVIFYPILLRRQGKGVDVRWCS